MSNEKSPVLLDFNGDVIEALHKLESILYTSGWNNYLIIDPDTPTENNLLFFLIRERAIVVGEYYYTFTHDFPRELENKAYNYFHRLRKRDMDSIYLNAVNYFSKFEPDIEKTDKSALFYPNINAYVRCGDLSPEKMFDLMKKDGCERVIIFGSGLRQDKDEPWEIFHSFEMNAPKEYIMEQLAKLQEEKTKTLFDAINRVEKNGMYDNIIPSVNFEE